jgi:P pilus assembly chaperone PapD
MNSLICAARVGLLALCLVTGAADASVVIAGTRVIFPAGEGEVTVRLTNQNATPALIEAWIDNGDAHSTPDKVSTPFLITPPLFRMEPARDQSLRILYTRSQQPLPTDRESVFWLNVLEIPPKPSTPQFQGKNYLQVAIRSRLKLFYRPAGLAGDPIKAASELSFRAASTAGSGVLVVHNPTPYYITISQITLNAGAASHKVGTGMVAPLSDLRVTVSDLKQAPSAGSAIEYHCINDYGSNVALKGIVRP